MKKSYLLVAVLLFGTLTTIAHAVTTEKPLFAKFKGTADSDAPLIEYVQFGKFSDGTDTIQNAGAGVVRFFTRVIFGKPNVTADYYNSQEINCNTGMVTVVGAGFLPNLHGYETPIPLATVKMMNKKNVPVYAEICRTAGVRPRW